MNMKGRGFKSLLKTGDKVKAGQKIMEFDIGAIKAAGHPATSAFIITNSGDCKLIDFKTNANYEAMDVFGTVEAILLIFPRVKFYA